MKNNALMMSDLGIPLLYDGLQRHAAHYCDPVQLYDTARDPAEQTNVAAVYPERVTVLLALIVRHVAETEGRKLERRAQNKV